MDIRTYIQKQMTRVWSQIDAAVNDTTDEQFNWPPPGTINPISAVFVHMLISEDYFINTVVQGKSPFWVEQGWDQKTGVQTPPEWGRSWDEFRTAKISVAPVLAYQQAVRVATDTYLADLTAEELERGVEFAGNELPVAEVLTLLVVHSASHAGEIAAVKGMQGLRGLPD
jgi:uncharacterized damage-inducible protein DinB